MVWIGALIVILTFVAIVRQYETRMVLFVSGLTMLLLGSGLLKGFVGAMDAFTKAMVNPGLVTVICMVMGFAYVMKLTKCDAHLVHFLAGGLGKLGPALIPGAVLVTFAINIALPSAAGCAAAVGAVLIPTLIGAGVHPAVAASAVMAGTWGSAFNPGNSHNPFIAKLAGSDPVTVIATFTNAALVGIAIVAISLTLMAILRKENKGYQSPDLVTADDGFKVNIFKAMIPAIPLILLVLGSKQLNMLPWEITVPQAMVIGVFLGFLTMIKDPSAISKQFWAGLGEAYGSVIGIIIAAAVFTAGMGAIGLTQALIDAMKNSQQIAQFGATFGPFIIAILSGSGDAATLAFNGAITPHAKEFGYGIIDMGSTAFLAGSLGRTMSPVAGAAIVCAGLAKINPIEITKRNGPGCLIAAIAVMVIML